MVYQPGEKAYLRVTPMKGAHRFGIKGKLAPLYIGPFTILERRGKVAYQLELPPNLSQVHDVFHVSQLRRCFKDPFRAVDHEVLELQQDLSYKEHPVRILDQAAPHMSESDQIPQGPVVASLRRRSHLGTRGPPA